MQKLNCQQTVQKATEELKQKCEADREMALKNQHQQMILKSKSELDALRKRFKMMQTAGALERSPSCSESELSIEVWHIYLSLSLQYETDLFVAIMF